MGMGMTTPSLVRTSGIRGFSLPSRTPASGASGRLPLPFQRTPVTWWDQTGVSPNVAQGRAHVGSLARLSAPHDDLWSPRSLGDAVPLGSRAAP